MVDRSLPNLLIAGVTKAGTTSLFWYLAQHPGICGASQKEVNYFAPMRYGHDVSPDLNGYAAYFRHCVGQPYRLEASPLYFYGGAALVQAVSRVLPDVRIIISLRDPVDRLWSAYRYKKLQGGLDASVDFGMFFQRSLQLREGGADTREENDLYRALSIGLYIESLRDWLDVFGEQVRVVFFEELATTPHIVVQEICEWLAIDTGSTQDFDYGVSQKTVKPRSRLLHHGARTLSDSADRLFGLNQHRRLKGMLRNIYFGVNASRSVEKFLPEDRHRVEAFYARPNEVLAEELLARGYRRLPGWLTLPPRHHDRTVAGEDPRRLMP